MPLLIVPNNILIVKQYKYHLRSLRRELVNTRYIFHKKFIRKQSNKPLMFVRAPKHFKSGKQHIFFFNGIFLKKLKLNSSLSYKWVFKANNKHLFDHLRSNICEIRDPGVTLNRLSFICDVKFKYE